MASKRHVRRRSCESKQRFANESDARAGLAHANRREYHGPMTAYRCHFCKSWHYGRIPFRLRR